MDGQINVNQKLFLTLTCLTQGGENLIDTIIVIIITREGFLEKT